MKAFATFFFFLIAATFSYAQCDSSSMQLIQVRASDTDPNISWELARHHVFINEECTPQNKLLVHMVGSYDNPTSTLKFPAIAANHGFHVVSLKYPNSVAAQTACAGSSDSSCYLKFRKEILEGIDYSAEVDVDTIDCVYNRLIKLLKYLDANYPAQNWEQFFSGNDITWSKVLTSGHSQGGGHAAVIGVDHQLSRVLMFASPNDYSNLFSMPAPWTSSAKATHDSLFYGLNNLNDDVVSFADQMQVWSNLGMPNYGDTVLVNNSSSSYANSRQLYTNFNVSGTGVNHSLVVRDDEIVLNIDGSPYFEEAWKYMLGVTEVDTTTANMNNEPVISRELKIHPNPVRRILQVELPSEQIQTLKITSLAGQVLSVNSCTNVIDLSSFKKGVYLLEVETIKGEKHQRTIVKQ